MTGGPEGDPAGVPATSAGCEVRASQRHRRIRAFARARAAEGGRTLKLPVLLHTKGVRGPAGQTTAGAGAGHGYASAARSDPDATASEASSAVRRAGAIAAGGGGGAGVSARCGRST